MADLVVRIEDSVYDRVECDRAMALQLNDAFSVEVPGARFMPAVKSGWWDGRVRTFQLKTGLIYAGLRSKLREYCATNGYSIEEEQRESILDLDDAGFADLVERVKPTHEPRDYQASVVKRCAGAGRLLVLSPTASGKSLMYYMLTRYYSVPTLVIVPTTTLVHQLASDFSEYGYDSDRFIAKLYGGQPEPDGQPITVSTWQSLVKRPPEWFDRYRMVIGDEAHAYDAKSLVSIMTGLRNCDLRFGFTGTLTEAKTNGLVLEGLFGEVYRPTTTAELMEREFVADLKLKCLSLSYGKESRKLVSKMKYHEEIGFLVSHERRNRFISNLALGLEGNTLVLYNLVDNHGKKLYSTINESSASRGKIAYYVSGKVDGSDRDEIRRTVDSRAEDGKRDSIVVASYGSFSTGINIKNIDNLIMASPVKSRIRNLQSIGRGLRRTEGKTTVTVYDISDDLIWRRRKNFGMKHMADRLETYVTEGFTYKLYEVEIE